MSQSLQTSPTAVGGPALPGTLGERLDRRVATAHERVGDWLNVSRAGAIACCLVVGILAGLYFDGLGIGDLKDWDESVYATRALAIYLHGGAMWLDQVQYAWDGYYSAAFPPLLVWMSAAMFDLFGVSEFAHRFPTCLISATALFGMYLLGRSLRRRGTGVLAALFLFSVYFYTLYARRGQFDALFISFLVWAYHFYIAAQIAPDAAARRRQLIWCGAMLGLSLMSKIVIGGVLFVGVVAPFALWRIATRRTTWRHFGQEIGWIFAIAMVVWAPWHLYMAFHGGRDFLWYYFVFHVFNRTSQVLDNHRHPQWWYFQLLHWDVVTPVLVAAVWGCAQGVRELFRRAGAAVARSAELNAPGLDWASSYVFASWSFLMPLVLYTTAATKRDTYILPMIPPLALVAAVFVSDLAAGAYSGWRTCVVTASLLASVLYSRHHDAVGNVDAMFNLPDFNLFSRGGWLAVQRNILPPLLGGAFAALVLWGLLEAARADRRATIPRVLGLAGLLGTLYIAAPEGVDEALARHKGRLHYGWKSTREVVLARQYDELIYFSFNDQPAQAFYLMGSARFPMTDIPCRMTGTPQELERFIAEARNPLIFLDLAYLGEWNAAWLEREMSSLVKIRTVRDVNLYAKPGTDMARLWGNKPWVPTEEMPPPGQDWVVDQD